MAAVTISETHLYHYRLPFVRPLKLKLQTLVEREGLLVQIADECGHVGWGEIAPLAGFNRDTLEQARVSAIHVLRKLRGRELPELPHLLKNGMASAVDEANEPSVVLGIEMALLNLWGEIQECGFRRFLNASASDSITCNGLLIGRTEEIVHAAQQMTSEGYVSLKLKVGSDSVENEIARVQQLRSAIPTQVKLRLDANRSWDFKTAVTFGKEVADQRIEYIEEPCADIGKLESLFDKTGIKYALDESMAFIKPEHVARAYGLAAFIIKPTRFGLMRSFNAAGTINDLKITVVISSSFESSLGLLALSNLACAAAPRTACGLGTAGWFERDLITRPLISTGGRIDLSQYDRTSVDVKKKSLSELSLD